MDRIIENLLLATRWLLLPLYLSLLTTVLAIYVMAGRELIHLVDVVLNATDAELVLIILNVLDLVLVANLLVMVAISSYESFISKISVAEGGDQPEWLGKLDSSNVKLKVALSIVMISAIHLLRAFMQNDPSERLGLLAMVHLVFVASTLAIAVVDRLHRPSH